MKHLKKYEDLVWEPTGSNAFDNSTIHELIYCIKHEKNDELISIMNEWDVDPDIDFVICDIDTIPPSEEKNYETDEETIERLEKIHNPNDYRLEDIENHNNVDAWIPINYTAYEDNYEAYKILVEDFGADILKRDLEESNIIYILVRHGKTDNRIKIGLHVLNNIKDIDDNDLNIIHEYSIFSSYEIQEAFLLKFPEHFDKIKNILHDDIKNDERFSHLIESDELGII